VKDVGRGGNTVNIVREETLNGINR